jgi:hypothetical protein
LLELFGLLMMGGADQKIMQHPRHGQRDTDLQTLAIGTDWVDPINQMGKTAALKELAWRTAHDGHLPILLDHPERTTSWPISIEEFIAEVRNAVRTSLNELQLETGAMEFLAETGKVEAWQPGQGKEGLCPEAGSYVVGSSIDKCNMLAAAMTVDLLACLDVVRAGFGRPEAKLVLLIDDVHLMADAGRFIVKYLLAEAGLRSKNSRRDDLRAIFSYSKGVPAPELAEATGFIEAFLPRKYVAKTKLEPFRKPTESQLALENYLLKWRTGSTVNGDVSPLVFLKEHEFGGYAVKQFEKRTLHIPSRLGSIDMTEYMEAMLELPEHSRPFRKAKDEDIYKWCNL